MFLKENSLLIINFILLSHKDIGDIIIFKISRNNLYLKK